MKQEGISQVDLAPTILELAGLRSPWGYFGRSLLHKAKHSYFGILNEELTIRTDEQVETIAMNAPKDEEERNLISLLNTIFTKHHPLESKKISGMNQ